MRNEAAHRSGARHAPRAARARPERAPERRRVTRVLDLLERAYGRPSLSRRLDPMDELVLTVLSQSTSDRNRDRAWRSLKGRFPTWDAAGRAPRAALEAAIRPGGLARTKSRVLVDLLRSIRVERGGYDLDHLRHIPLEEARAWLCRFRGVGEKTAACVLLFACDRPAFPVDTHVGRVARRLGWLPERASTERAHRILERLIPEERFLTAHLNLISLGRAVCRPARPDCPRCPLRRSCRTGAGRGREGASRRRGHGAVAGGPGP